MSEQSHHNDVDNRGQTQRESKSSNVTHSQDEEHDSSQEVHRIAGDDGANGALPSSLDS